MCPSLQTVAQLGWAKGLGFGAHEPAGRGT
jgi:hypothetical protein